MKKYLIILTAAIAIIAGSFALAGCNQAEEEVIPTTSTERVKYTERTNPYAECGWEEFPYIVDWDKKLTDDPVYYEFDGFWSDAYGDYSDKYLYLNCYEDGGLYAVLDDYYRYYGYWTNVDEKGKSNLVLHVLNCNGKEYGQGEYELECEKIKNDYYEFYSTIIWDWGWYKCAVVLGGYHYSPVESLAVSGEQTRAIVGEDFSTHDLTIKLTRENGKSKDYNCWSSVYRFKFDGYDSSKVGICEVSVGCLGSDVKTSYKCEVFGIRRIKVDTSDYVKDYLYVGEDVKDYCYSLPVYAIREGGKKIRIYDTRGKCSFEGIDENSRGEGEIIITYNPTGQKTSFRYTVYDIVKVEFDFTNAKTHYIVGDKFEAANICAKVTYDNGKIFTEYPYSFEITGFDSNHSAEKQEIKVSYREYEDSFFVEITALEFTGTAKYGDKTGEAKIRLATPDRCEYTFDGETIELNYLTRSYEGNTYCILFLPEDSGVAEQTFNLLHKKYILYKSNGRFKMTNAIYEIPSDGYGEGSNSREQEPVKDFKYNSEERFILIDEEKGEATLTYKYWYKNAVDTFICKYKIDDGVLTFTEPVTVIHAGSGASFEALHKSWILHEDGTATKYISEE